MFEFFQQCDRNNQGDNENAPRSDSDLDLGAALADAVEPEVVSVLTLPAEKSLIALHAFFIVQTSLNAFMLAALDECICPFDVLVAGKRCDLISSVTFEDVVLALEAFLEEELAIQRINRSRRIQIIGAGAALAVAITVDDLVLVTG